MKTTLKVSRSFRSQTVLTPEVLAIQAMYGIGADPEHQVLLYKDLEVTIGTGRIVFLTGMSGGGKSTLLRDLREEALTVMDVIETPTPDPSMPICSQFGSVKEGLELLTFCGISEPFVMLRKPGELSDGQRYRFTLGLLIREARKVAHPVVFMDEFLAMLDRVTAKAVAYQTRKVSTVAGICFVVATTHEDLMADLSPNTVVTMQPQKQPLVDRRVIG